MIDSHQRFANCFMLGGFFPGVWRFWSFSSADNPVPISEPSYACFSISSSSELGNMASHKQNVVGPQIRKLRDKQGLTQEMFAAKCSVMGFELTRVTLAKIETQLRCVSDSELWTLAKALKVELKELYPGKR